jgi:hypothetical protein
MPTLINTFPKFTEMLPANTLTGVNAAMSYLSARKKPIMVSAYKDCDFRMEVENNLLTRQAAPMLLTNGGVGSRELYSPGFLSTVTCILNMAISKSPMGMAMVTMRTRFAGLHRPGATDIFCDKRLQTAPQEQ